MIRLRPYKSCDAQTITKWIKDEFAFRQWSADRYEKYPITFDDTDIVGHFTMRFPNSDNFDEIRLGFVIVNDKMRGKGYGKEMLSLAIQYAFDFVKVKKISLGVFENNKAAIKCYESCGFKRVQLKNVESYHCTGEIWNCIEMELDN